MFDEILSKFSWIFEFGAVIVSSPGPCASSGGRLPEALLLVFRLESQGAKVLRPDDACQKRFSWFLDLNQKVQKCVHLVDLVKSFQTSIYYLHAKFGFDTAENRLLKV